MAHHKRSRPKQRRAGCLLCKPQKLPSLKKAERRRGRRDALLHELKLSADAAPQARPRVVRIATFNPAEMQRSGGYWNQEPGLIDKAVSELLAELAAQEARSGLSLLAEKLAGLRASDA